MKEIKYHIDPYNTDIQGTICATIRTIWRTADGAGNEEIKQLSVIAFDQANRMSEKLKKYRKRFLTLPKELQEELDKIC